jgi:hypothetical protein
VSEIYGTGYGSAHDWQKVRSTWGGPIDYRCRRCGAEFAFDPAKGHINYWRVIEAAGIAEDCARPKLPDLRRAA